MIAVWSNAQEDLSIILGNPSFEDMPRHSKAPRGWYNCGDPYESPPDVHPTPDSSFSVKKPPFAGKTYLGLVVRDNDTHESVGQRLKRPVEGGKCYEFSIALSRSSSYISLSRRTSEEVNYTTPAKLRIWGGNNYCSKIELLAESTVVTNTRWLVYNFRFEPTASHKYILLEAFYNTPTLFAYNGHILVDGATEIVPIPCEEPQELVIEEPVTVTEEIAAATAPVATPKVNVEPKPKPNPPTQAAISSRSTEKSVVQKPQTTVVTKPKEEVMLDGVARKDLRVGQRITIKNLFFDADQSAITSSSFRTLDNVYRFLHVHQDIIIEVGGHTNNVPPDYYCDELSTERAKSVASYLTDKGIAPERIQYKGYGKRQPIAPNKTPVGRKRNQRVELKVIGFDG